MIGRIAAHLRDRLGQGLLIWLPLLITLWLLGLLFGLVTPYVAPLIVALLKAFGVEKLDSVPARLTISVVGLLVSVAFVYLAGLLAANLVGRRILALIESAILRVPFVKGIYGSARQLLDAFASGGGKAFSRVVLVEYPRSGLWTLGFVTAEVAAGPGGPLDDTLAVFLPTTPNPTSGWVVLVPRKDVVDLDLSVEEGIKLVVSGGIVSPPNLAGRARPRAEQPPAGERPPVSALCSALRARGVTVATAESCTGGLLGGSLTDEAGASSWYRGGVVAYHDDVKVSLLGVRPETIERHGAVSEQTAVEMASSSRALLGADYGIGVTGIAGPTGGSEAKPLGLVVVAVADSAGTEARRMIFSGGRDAIRARAVAAALDLLWKRLEGS